MQNPPTKDTARLSVRLRFHDNARIGPGKIALLEAIRASGSIAAAGASQEMSARRAWLLIDSLNKAFDQPVVTTDHDPGSNGAEANLTTFGEQLVQAYRAVEADTQESVRARFAELKKHLRPQEQ